METVKRFEDLRVWQVARDLTRLVYAMTSSTPFAKDLSLRDQMRRAAVSAMANIAEGFERSGDREFCQFLAQAKASAGELRSHCYVALDQDYAKKSQCQEILDSAETLSRMLHDFIVYLRESPVRGIKYRRASPSNLKP